VSDVDWSTGNRVVGEESCPIVGGATAEGETPPRGELSHIIILCHIGSLDFKMKYKTFFANVMSFLAYCI
jgi:hypothetical protein